MGMLLQYKLVEHIEKRKIQIKNENFSILD